jgi:hypothetical protein
MSKEIARIHTSCKNCVFAKYENITQTGCELNYLEIFKSKNIDILEAYDEDKEFYILNNKSCIGYTKREFIKKYNLDQAPIETIITEYNKLNKLNYIAMINAKHINLSKLTTLINSISSMPIKPQKIIVVRYPDSNNKLPYYALKKFFDNIDMKWKIISAQEATDPIETFINLIANTESSFRFLLTINDIDAQVENLVNTANNIVHTNLDQFILLKDKETKAMLFSMSVYRYDKFMGNNLLQNLNTHITI